METPDSQILSLKALYDKVELDINVYDFEN